MIIRFSIRGTYQLTISIKDALKLPIMEETKLIAGEKGLNNHIHWVTVIEIVEDIDRLQPGEFLITTGFKLLEDQTRLESFHRLLESELLSGVAIYTSFYMTEIPDSFIQLADKHHLPLIEIPVDINFSEITKEILAQLVNQQAYLLAHSEKTHHELTKLVLNDQSLTEVTKRLAQLTSAKLVIYNEFYDIIYHNNDFCPMDNCSFSNSTLFVHDQEINLSQYLLRSLDKEAKENIILDQNIITIYPIIAKQSCFGWIALLKPKAHWQEMDDVAIGRASTIYAMEFLKKQAVEETRMRIQSNLLEDIFNKNEANERLIIDQALKLNYDLSLTQSVFHVTFKQSENVATHVIDRLYYMTENVLIQKNKQHIIQAKLQSIIFLTNVLGKTPEEQYEHAKQLADELLTEWQFYFPKNELVIGIGKSYHQLSSLSASAQEARDAVTLYPLINDSIQAIHYDDLGMYDFLIKMRREGIDLQAVFQEKISGLLHDAAREIDLLETIYIYFKNNQSIQKSAEKLFIHRHTLRYRLKQVEQKTGLHLKNTDDLLKLQIGVMAFKLGSILDRE